MIYEIRTNQLPMALENNCKILSLSIDSITALIQTININELEIIETFDESELYMILVQEKWRQPCTNC
jgi:hypothetical protein